MAQVGPVHLALGSSTDVTFSLRFVSQHLPPQRQLSGSVLVRNMGSTPLLPQQLLVEVVPQGEAVAAAAGTAAGGATAGTGQQPQALAPVVLHATCPIDSHESVTAVIAAAAAAGAAAAGSSSSGSSGSTAQGAAAAAQPLPIAAVPAGELLRCSFAGTLPSTMFTGLVSVSAKLVQLDGTVSSSQPVVHNLEQQQPQQVVEASRCAVVSDGFVGGRGRLVPRRSSRPAGAAAPTRICNSQSVSFVATLGPLGPEACGRELLVSRVVWWVVRMQR